MEKDRYIIMCYYVYLDMDTYYIKMQGIPSVKTGPEINSCLMAPQYSWVLLVSGREVNAAEVTLCWE